jgi:hypothetical protein
MRLAPSAGDRVSDLVKAMLDRRPEDRKILTGTQPRPPYDAPQA